MTKQDILKLDSRREIVLALYENMNLLDQEVSDHLASVARKEDLEKYGSPDVLVTPLKRKAPSN